MYTRCPACHTYFRVTSEQLGVARGKVRCGECRTVFYAPSSLTEKPPADTDKTTAFTPAWQKHDHNGIAPPAPGPSEPDKEPEFSDAATGDELPPDQQMDSQEETSITNRGPEPLPAESSDAAGQRPPAPLPDDSQHHTPLAESWPDWVGIPSSATASTEEAGVEFMPVDEIAPAPPTDGNDEAGEPFAEPVSTLPDPEIHADQAIEEPDVDEEDSPLPQETIASDAEDTEQGVEAFDADPLRDTDDDRDELTSRLDDLFAGDNNNEFLSAAPDVHEAQSPDFYPSDELLTGAQGEIADDGLDLKLSIDLFASSFGQAGVEAADAEKTETNSASSLAGAEETSEDTALPAAETTDRAIQEDDTADTGKDGAPDPIWFLPDVTDGHERTTPAHWSALLQEENAPPRWSWKGLFWGSGIFLLILTLGVQLVFLNRYKLVKQEAWQPALEWLCNILPCDLPLRQDLDAIVILERDLRTHASIPDALSIDATLENRATFAQPYPQLEIIMKDLDGRIIISGLFKPMEYLPDSLKDGSLFASQATVRLQLNIQDPGPEAVGFELKFH